MATEGNGGNDSPGTGNNGAVGGGSAASGLGLAGGNGFTADSGLAGNPPAGTVSVGPVSISSGGTNQSIAVEQAIANDPSVAAALAADPSSAAALSAAAPSLMSNAAQTAVTVAKSDPFAGPGINMNAPDMGFGITGPSNAPADTHVGAHMAANVLGFGVAIAAEAAGVGAKAAIAMGTAASGLLNNNPTVVSILDHVTDPLVAGYEALQAIAPTAMGIANDPAGGYGTGYGLGLLGSSPEAHTPGG